MYDAADPSLMRAVQEELDALRCADLPRARGAAAETADAGPRGPGPPASLRARRLRPLGPAGLGRSGGEGGWCPSAALSGLTL